MPTTTTTGVSVDNLPGVLSVSVPGQKEFDGLPFPLILIPDAASSGRSIDDWVAWIGANLTALRAAIIRYGAVLFRGFATPTPADFDRFTKAFGWAEFPYVGGVSVREAIVGNVYTSTESPPECKIPFHHEMAHVADYPKVLNSSTLLAHYLKAASLSCILVALSISPGCRLNRINAGDEKVPRKRIIKVLINGVRIEWNPT